MQKRQRFTAEFKREAVRLLSKRGRIHLISDTVLRSRPDYSSPTTAPPLEWMAVATMAPATA